MNAVVSFGSQFFRKEVNFKIQLAVLLYVLLDPVYTNPG